MRPPQPASGRLHPIERGRCFRISDRREVQEELLANELPVPAEQRDLGCRQDGDEAPLRVRRDGMWTVNAEMEKGAV